MGSFFLSFSSICVHKSLSWRSPNAGGTWVAFCLGCHSLTEIVKCTFSPGDPWAWSSPMPSPLAALFLTVANSSFASYPLSFGRTLSPASLTQSRNPPDTGLDPPRPSICPSREYHQFHLRVESQDPQGFHLGASAFWQKFCQHKPAISFAIESILHHVTCVFFSWATSWG